MIAHLTTLCRSPCGIYGGQSDNGADFHHVHHIPLSVSFHQCSVLKQHRCYRGSTWQHHKRYIMCHNPEGHKSKFVAASRHAKKKRIKGCFALVYLHKVATGLSSYFCPVPNRNQPSATSSMRSAEEDNHNGSPPKQMKVSPVSVICLMVRAKVLE